MPSDEELATAALTKAREDAGFADSLFRAYETQERHRWRERLVARVQDRPALGAFPRRPQQPAPTVEEWIGGDPTRLGNVVRESARFTRDWFKIAESVVELADHAGVDEGTANQVIAEAIGNLRREGASRVG